MNLPPGVSSNMIPGNRPEDEEDDEFFNAFEKQFAAQHPEHSAVMWKRLAKDEELDDAIFNALRVARDMGYAAGATDASIDAQMDKLYKDERRGQL